MRSNAAGSAFTSSGSITIVSFTGTSLNTSAGTGRFSFGAATR